MSRSPKSIPITPFTMKKNIGELSLASCGSNMEIETLLSSTANTEVTSLVITSQKSSLLKGWYAKALNKSK